MKHNHISAITAATISAALIGTAFVATHFNHVAPDQYYPDPQLSPGTTATDNYQELTRPNPCGTYSQCHRRTTDAMKKQVCIEYPQNCKGQAGVDYEIDHICSLAIGCADVVANLWAQPAVMIWNGENFGFHTKDRLEAYLAAQVKAKAITPHGAQQCLLVDWIACFKRYLGTPNFGALQSTDPDNE